MKGKVHKLDWDGVDLYSTKCGIVKHHFHHNHITVDIWSKVTCKKCLHKKGQRVTSTMSEGIRVADYIFKYLQDQGVEYVFMVVGGGAMHLNDAIKKSGIKYVCFHHEQAAAIAAEGYFRTSGKMACVCVTSGAGGLNCLTGVMGQWTDSIPCLYLSGQVPFNTTIASCPELKLRQLGDQEVDIVSIVKPITKYAKMVTKAEEIPQEIEKALKEALQGRFAPVWIDVPLDIQKAEINV